MKEYYLEIEIKLTKIYLFLDLFHFGAIFHQFNTSTVCRQWRSLGFATAWWCTIAFTRLQRSQYLEWIYLCWCLCDELWHRNTSTSKTRDCINAHCKSSSKELNHIHYLLQLDKLKSYNHRVKLIWVEL